MPDTRPNIILIITDQQRYDTIAALGFPYMDTPHMDRLVREGVAFENCFVSAPLCVPARASLFTGQYPHTTGVFSNGDPWRHAWVEQLAAAGYHCVNIGKMHTVPLDTPLGFHQRYVVENKDRFLGPERFFFDEWDKALAAQGLVKQQRLLYRQRPDYRERLGAFDWELPEELHSDNFVGNTALWWLDRYPKTEPLFLQIGFPGPHPPYDPIPRYAEPYLARDLPLLEVTEEELANQPPPLQARRVQKTEVDNDSIVHLLNPTREQRHRQRAHYMANVTMIDEKLGEILHSLEARSYLESAVVILTSDHGDCLTDHGQSQKETMYDIVTRVPTIVWSPDRFEGGRRVPDLYQWMDLGPTILELAGLTPSPAMDAISILPALRGDADAPVRDHVFAEYAPRGEAQGFMTMVRDPDWKLVHFLDEPYGQLFHLAEDPAEVRNLWDEPRAEGEKRRLLDAMRGWLVRSHYQTRDWKRDFR
jgi:arylsulfatase A-like enzyme